MGGLRSETAVRRREKGPACERRVRAGEAVPDPARLAVVDQVRKKRIASPRWRAERRGTEELDGAGARGGGAQADEVRRARGVGGRGCDRVARLAVEALAGAGRLQGEEMRGLGGDEERVRDAAREVRQP